jgi:hypothetical protein
VQVAATGFAENYTHYIRYIRNQYFIVFFVFVKYTVCFKTFRRYYLLKVARREIITHQEHIYSLS